MLIEKISTKKVSDTVSEQIEKMILDGSIPAGEKLPSVRELCERFGVGRSAVRDAITVLKGKGLVKVKQGEGTYVSKYDSSKIFSKAVMLPNANDITELFQVRKIVETGMAEMAACNRSEKDLTLMKKILTTQTDAPGKMIISFTYRLRKQPETRC
ncbi:GntR family transcriptional regulator [Bacillus sp. OVS6]|nr:GntR family transcriptional regulator [Bacillus sp. OVS6]